MDTDWCLACDCHFQGTGPYCSSDCKNSAGPSNIVHHDLQDPFSSLDDFDDSTDDLQSSQWAGNGPAGIVAWASEIPPSAPVSSGASTPRSVRSATSLSSSQAMSLNTSSSFLPPKLLRSNHHPVAPTLCMTSPPRTPSSPSRPILTPQQNLAALSMSRYGDTDSIGKTSLLSAPTESSIATPLSARSVHFTHSKDSVERPSILGTIATHVRSWVSPTTPLPPSLPKLRTDSQKFSSAVNIAFSSQSHDDFAPVWHLSSTILIDKSLQSNDRRLRDVRSSQLPYKSRGRKLSRAAA